jgi:major vault protein
MDDRNTKRDLVLAPGEYAYMQDVTKGVIKTYTGPTVINPTAQERAVQFNQTSKRFLPCQIDEAVQQCAIAPEGYYIILKNPAVKADFPPFGGVYPAPDLDVGKKINITGPCMFSLWPGQIFKLVQGHHLRSNQYLLVRVYNEDEARRNWGKAIIKLAVTDGQTEAVEVMGNAPQDLNVGTLFIIKGTDVSFYIPPTGVGVVPDENLLYVRDALTLERLEYCILVDQNGKKRFERGPQVVFPEPTETFIVRDKHRKFRALELNEIQGLHVKVIAPYEEAGKCYQEGDEIFITGKETAIYFPREEHSLVRYDGRDKHFAVAVPSGEARYVMNRKTGTMRMVRGPAMLLPNPVDEVIVRRVLSEKESITWYPGNNEALTYNRSLNQLAAAAPTTRSGAVSEGDVQRSRRRVGKGLPAGGIANLQISDDTEFSFSIDTDIQEPSQSAPSRRPAMEASGVSRDVNAVAGDVVERGSTFTQPRTLVFNTKYEGVPSINVWVGYAIMIVDKQGHRRVEQGPKNVLLEYDETLQIIALSRGRPKSAEQCLHTVYLRVLNNQISDSCIVNTSDYVRVRLGYALRVNFVGEPNRWFEVENYVQFLCDHVRSVLKGALKRHSIENLLTSAYDIIRDTVLGTATDGKRSGMSFVENGMTVTDIEVLEVMVEDKSTATLLDQAQHEVVENHIALARANRALDVTRQQEEIQRQVATAQAETVQCKNKLSMNEVQSELELQLAKIRAEMSVQYDFEGQTL